MISFLKKGSMSKGVPGREEPTVKDCPEGEAKRVRTSGENGRTWGKEKVKICFKEASNAGHKIRPCLEGIREPLKVIQ